MVKPINDNAIRTARGIFNKVITNRLIAWKAIGDFSLPKQWDFQQTLTSPHWSGNVLIYIHLLWWPHFSTQRQINKRTCYWERSQESVTVITPIILQKSISNNYIISNASGILFRAAVQSLWYREGNKTRYRVSMLTSCCWIWLSTKGYCTKIMLLIACISGMETSVIRENGFSAQCLWMDFSHSHFGWPIK